ncbi:MAG: AMP-binding protein [Gammaproteobacteria bacterium]|nr:AMP-binding protein [Gammaproteobacteria bacterium]
MKQITVHTIPQILQDSFAKYSDNKGFSFVNGKQNTYADLKKEINKVANLLIELGIKKGDKVAILAVNSPQWVATYMAIGALGVTTVPILPDFANREVAHILEHSAAKAVFVSQNLVEKLPEHLAIDKIAIENQQLLSDTNTDSGTNTDAPIALSDADFPYADVDEDDLLAIIYTSGTTGSSKGVMLSHKNIISNACQALQMQNVGTDDRFLSILPLSHTFENTLGMVIPCMCGSSVYYLDKLPTPSVLLPAMAKIKPTMFLLVPLVIEKIYKGKILKEINSKPLTKKLYQYRPTQKLLNYIAGKKLYKAFGGELVFFGIGGAKLDATVERFLLDCKFPYSIGYGMTETSPVMAGAFTKNRRVGGAGVPVPDIELRIAKENPDDEIGEIQVKGPNVMKGYYKAPEITAEVFTEDGWLRTGDLGLIDKEGLLSIKGRIKTMILGASGENIYPEEIESVINKMDLVQESLVTEKAGKLVAMVHLNMEELEKRAKQLQESMAENLSSFKDDAVQHTDEAKKYLEEKAKFIEEKAESTLKEMRLLVNKELSKFSQIKEMVFKDEPFEKTPTHKIKRFLYDLNKSSDNDTDSKVENKAEKIVDKKEDDKADNEDKQKDKSDS